jgi:peptide/nickel transport system substrate-binding protein
MKIYNNLVAVMAATALLASVSPTISQELAIAVTSENTTLASHQTGSEVNSPGLRNVFEVLVARNPETNELAPELATSWTQIDPTTWEFELRQGVSYHDGSPFDAEAAAFAINFSWSEEQDFPLRQFMATQITAEAVGDYTLRVMTVDPDPLVPERMYFTGIPSMQAILTARDTYDTTPVGTGPYRLREWQRGQYLLLEANPNWWGLDDPSVKNPEFETVRLMFRSEGGVRASMVKVGEANIAQFLDSDQCVELAAGDTTDCVSAPSVETLFIRFDTPSPVLGDVRVRRAVLHALDIPSIISEIMGGSATQASQIVGPASNGFDPAILPVAFDADAARSLVDEARANGVPVDTTEIFINVRQAAIPRIEEIAQAAQAMLTAVGLNATVKIQEASIYNPEYGQKPGPDRNYITMHPVGNDPMDAASSFQTYATCDRGTSGICDSELDAMITEASTLVGPARTAALQAISRRIQDEAYIGFVGHLDLAYGISSDLEWDVPLDHRLIVRNMGLAE